MRRLGWDGPSASGFGLGDQVVGVDIGMAELPLTVFRARPRGVTGRGRTTKGSSSAPATVTGDRGHLQLACQCSGGGGSGPRTGRHPMTAITANSTPATLDQRRANTRASAWPRMPRRRITKIIAGNATPNAR